ncbi:uncharacterized protein LOC143276887 [Babylonia areolata]|uniref:uncharacterized protein LOC143276887 n=1 Tax=Babylonia areolata TaxID=304850 RepID=UPI003FD081CE
MNGSSQSPSVTIQFNLTKHGPTTAQNSSLGEGCIEVIFSEMEFLPWDNPDNIVSTEVEAMICRIKNNVLVLLFLIGGPANVINMAVFCRQGLKDRVNLCLFALSLADGLYLTMAVVLHGEQLRIQFTTKHRFGPLSSTLSNNNLIVLVAPFCYISPVLSAIIAVERCLCVYNPLRFQSLLRTRTMVVIISMAYILVFGLFFIVAYRYRVGCVHDPALGIVVTTAVAGDVYRAHKEVIDLLESFVFGVGLPGVEMIMVTTATMMTIMKLRQAVLWRSETSSSSPISPQEVALTRMLVGTSILFVVCIFPIALSRITWLFLPEVSSGRRNHNFFLTGVWIGELFTYVNATFNIFVYYVMGSRYRKTFWALFGRKTQPDTASVGSLYR